MNRPCPRLAILAAATAFTLCGLRAQNQSIQLTTGVDGGVIYQYDSRFLPPTGMTVEAWITYDDSTIPTGLYYWPTVARQNVTPNQESWNLRVNAANNGNRALGFIIRTQAQSNQLYTATYNFAPGEFQNWTHVAGTFDGTDIKLYKNGVLVATQRVGVTSQINNVGGELRVGNGDPVNPGYESWNGQIDELRIWPMARSAAEITQSMNDQLWFMPGGVLEFDYDGRYNEFSQNIAGAPFGTIAFAPGAPSLVLAAPAATVVGQASSTCPVTAEIAIGSLPAIGNNAFTLWSIRGPTAANSQLGLLVAAFAAAPTGLPPFHGVNLAFDPTTVLATLALIPASNALGNTAFSLPIPNNAGLVGVSLVYQFGFQDSQCGPNGFSAGSGLQLPFQ